MASLPNWQIDAEYLINSLQCEQKSLIAPYLKPPESTPHFHNAFYSDPF
jgi:hypothetical protein